MTKKTLTISIGIALAWIIGMTVLVALTIGDQRYIDREGTAVIWKKDADLITFAPNQALDAKQYITATQDDISRLILYTKTASDISLACELLDPATGVVVRAGQTAIAKAGSVMPVTWTFEPIPDSQNKKYIAHITGRVGAAPLSIFTVEPNRFDGGPLLIDGQPQESMRIVLDWQYYDAYPWQTLFQRLTYAKPGPLNLTGMAWGLTVMYALAGLLSLGTCLYVLFRD